MVLIHDDEAVWAGLSDEERGRHLAAYGALYQEMAAAGHAVEGDGLAPARTATIVRRREGRVLTSDGPFTETKEQLGGFFLLECDLDTAVAYAGKLPSADTATIEIRPVGPM
jgi:hypothetical protein